MASLKRYNEVATRFHNINGRKINEGDVVRTVAISERDAAINNDMTEEHGFKYVLAEEVEEKGKAKEPGEKEIRAELFAKAAELGLNLPKNTKTETLKAKVEEKENEGK